MQSPVHKVGKAKLWELCVLTLNNEEACPSTSPGCLHDANMCQFGSSSHWWEINMALPICSSNCVTSVAAAFSTDMSRRIRSQQSTPLSDDSIGQPTRTCTVNVHCPTTYSGSKAKRGCGMFEIPKHSAYLRVPGKDSRMYICMYNFRYEYHTYIYIHTYIHM